MNRRVPVRAGNRGCDPIAGEREPVGANGGVRLRGVMATKHRGVGNCLAEGVPPSDDAVQETGEELWGHD